MEASEGLPLPTGSPESSLGQTLNTCVQYMQVFITSVMPVSMGFAPNTYSVTYWSSVIMRLAGCSDLLLRVQTERLQY